MTLFIPEGSRRFGLRLVDVAGRAIRTLAVSSDGQGMPEIPWDERDDSGNMVSPGVYFAQLYCAGWQSTKKIVVLGR